MPIRSLRAASIARWFTAAVLFMALGCQQEGEVPSTVQSGNKAPEISGTDVEGKLITLSQYQGKVVLLDFWATFCPPCRAAIPHEVDLLKRMSGRPFAILGISVDGERQHLQEFLARQPLPWPNIYDANGSIAQQWGISNIPVFVLIDHHGNIVNRWVGAHMDKIDAAVEKAVREAEKK